MSLDLGRIGAIARRDFYVEGSYRLRYMNRLIQVLITGVVVYQLNKLVVNSPDLARFGGNYFGFAMIGLAVLVIARLGISVFNANILGEQQQGTLEILMATPTRVSVWLAGSFVFPLLLTSIDLILYGAAIAVFGEGIRVEGLVYAVPLLVLTLGAFCAFGVMGASVVVLTKRGDPLTAPLVALTSILSGAIFPVSNFPLVLRIVAQAFPPYYGINGLREALLTDHGFADIAPDMVVLLGFDIVLLPLSVALFSRSLAAARRTGTLANY